MLTLPRALAAWAYPVGVPSARALAVALHLVDLARCGPVEAFASAFADQIGPDGIRPDDLRRVISGVRNFSVHLHADAPTHVRRLIAGQGAFARLEITRPQKPERPRLIVELNAGWQALAEEGGAPKIELARDELYRYTRLVDLLLRLRIGAHAAEQRAVRGEPFRIGVRDLPWLIGLDRIGTDADALKRYPWATFVQGPRPELTLGVARRDLIGPAIDVIRQNAWEHVAIGDERVVLSGNKAVFISYPVTRHKIVKPVRERGRHRGKVMTQEAHDEREARLRAEVERVEAQARAGQDRIAATMAEIYGDLLGSDSDE